MKLQLLSDLHLELQPDFVPQHAPGAEWLVLAGDIGSYRSGSLLTEPDFGLARFSPLRAGCPWREVFFLPGNQEYMGLDFDDTHARLREACERLGIVWLDRQVLQRGRLRFVGTTLWTDFDAFAPPGHAAADEPERLQRRQAAYDAVNGFLRNGYSSLRNGEPVLAAGMRADGLACQAWLRSALAQPFDGHTVVVTHFAPSLRSADPRFGLTSSTAGFCNALDDLLPLADVWLHGHLHCHHDYHVRGEQDGRAYDCRVVANPLGYVSKGEPTAFEPALCIEINAG